MSFKVANELSIYPWVVGNRQHAMIDDFSVLILLPLVLRRLCRFRQLACSNNGNPSPQVRLIAGIIMVRSWFPLSKNHKQLVLAARTTWIHRSDPAAIRA